MTISESIRTSIDDQFTSSSTADLYLRRRGVVRVDAAALEARLGAQDSRGYVDLSRVEGSLIGPDGTEPLVRSAPLEDAGSVFELGTSFVNPFEPGEDPAGGTGAALLSDASARTLGARVGDRVTLRSTSGRDASVVVRGVYRNSALVGPALVDRATAVRVDAEGSFELAGIVLDDRAPVERVRGLIDRNIGGFKPPRHRHPSRVGGHRHRHHGDGDPPGPGAAGRHAGTGGCRCGEQHLAVGQRTPPGAGGAAGGRGPPPTGPPARQRRGGAAEHGHGRSGGRARRRARSRGVAHGALAVRCIAGDPVRTARAGGGRGGDPRRTRRASVAATAAARRPPLEGLDAP